MTVKVGSEFLVNTETVGDQFTPAITGLSNGGFVVTWFDHSGTLGDSNGTSIKAQIFDAAGGKVGGEFLVNTQTANSQLEPAITGLTNGGFVVTWYDSSGTLDDSSGTSIKAQVFGATGSKVGSEFLVNTQTASDQHSPTIAGLTNGNFVVTWYDSSATLGDSSGSSIKAQLLDPTGSKLGAEFLVNTQTANSQFLPIITGLTNGNFVVTWQDESGTLGDSSGYGIKAQVFDANGAKLGSEFLVNTQTAGPQQSSNIASLTNGDFVITWLDFGSGSIKAQVFDATGAKVGSEFLVTTQFSSVVHCGITSLTNGRFVVSWHTGGDFDIKAQVFDATGAKLGSEFLVNTQTAGHQLVPVVTSLTNGDFVITWDDESSTLGDNNGTSIKAQIFTPTINETPVVTASGGTTAFTESNDVNPNPIAVDGGLMVSDFDSVTLASATVSITSAFQAGEDVLAFTNTDAAAMGNIAGSYAADTGILTLASDGATATLAQWQAALRAVTYTDTSDDPNTTTRTVDFVINDGTSNSTASTKMVSVAAVNDAPIITSNGGGETAAVSISENTLVATTVVAIDPDSPTLTYSIITGDDDAAKFQINSSTGVLSFITAPDFEQPTDFDANNSYIVQVRVSDNGNPSLFDAQAITVTVTDVFGTFTDNDAGHSLVGTAENDFIQGNGGNDTLTGEFGADRFVYASPADGVDLITDFSSEQGDKFVLDRVGFGLTGTGTLSAAGVDFVQGSTSRTAVATILAAGSDVYFDPDGTGPAAASLLAHIGTAAQDLVATGDFNGDGTDDLLWRNVSDGATTDWQLSPSGGVLAQGTLPSTAGYDLVATGDFNGDGTADLVWRNPSSGHTVTWLMSGSGATDSALPSTLGYSLVAQGDFNGDSVRDLMWKHDTSGQTVAWLMSATGSVAASASLSSTSGYGMLVAGDFNGDGTTDTLWKNVATGETVAWLMFAQPGLNKADAALSSTAGYNLVASGDFNADGHTDTIWKETSTGNTVAWLMFPDQNTNKSDAALSSTQGYSKVADGDFNADGTLDLLWRHDVTGETIAWLINAETGKNKTDIALPHTFGYTAVASGDFDHNGTTDILWKQTATGEVVEWLMSPSITGGIGFQASLPNAAGRSVLATGDFNSDGTTDVIWERASDGAAEEWLTVPDGAGVELHALASTGGVGVVHLAQDDFLVV